MMPSAGDPLGCIRDGALAAHEGRVVWIGHDGELDAQVDLDGDQLDAAGACVIPGLVDAHTHPVFAGSRADEFAERLGGAEYQAQQSGERGIVRTVQATRQADPAALLALADTVSICPPRQSPSTSCGTFRPGHHFASSRLFSAPTSFHQPSTGRPMCEP